MSTMAHTLGASGRPASAQELAALVREARVSGQALVPWGAGSRQHLGAPPPESALRLETSALDQVVDYVPEDLTITLQAGISIGSLQALLAEHRQWLPWEPPVAAQATLGGLLASAATGPLRLGYGTARDWLLGMQVALGDGRLVRSGSRVVKNVAGYDLHKLHLGALGTLGVITELTLKVLPLPEQEATLRASFPTLTAALAAAEELRAPPLAPAALALRRSAEHEALLLARYAGTPAAAARQVQVAAQRASTAGGQSEVLAASEGRTLWAAQQTVQQPQPERLLLRLGSAPAALPTALATLTSLNSDAELLALPGVGLAWAQLSAEQPALATMLARLRQELAPGGYAVVEASPAALALDLWGPPPPTIALMRQLKAQWDPAGILNPGRFMV